MKKLRELLAEKYKNANIFDKKERHLRKHQFSKSVNLILLLGKSYIHKSKISKIKPKLELFIPTLRDRYYIEENMFSKQGKEDIFLARWSFVP